MKHIPFYLPLFLSALLMSCGETKTIYQGNKLYQYDRNRSSGNEQVIEYTVNKTFQTKKLTDKTDFYQVGAVPDGVLTKTDSGSVDGELVGQFTAVRSGGYYTNESRTFLTGKQFEASRFRYYYGKFALTAVTIPFKFRSGLGNDTLYPGTLETSVNINFAPSYRFNWSFFSPTKKSLGSPLTNLSVTIGGLLGFAGTDLKKASNAPGLLSDRKAFTYTTGGTVLFGLNAFGIGYSFGWDKVTGSAKGPWIYQGKFWQGITFAVDLIK